LRALGVIPIGYQRRNLIAIEAGDEDGNWALVYQGVIFTALVNLSSAPEAPFTIYARTGLVDRMKPVPPLVSMR
jgi:hypothetical protein